MQEAAKGEKISVSGPVYFEDQRHPEIKSGGKEYELIVPRFALWNLDIEGPEYQQWPPASHRLLFGDETDASKIDIALTVVRFATRAFRRPVSPAEVDHYATFIRGRINRGDTHANAIKLGLAAILTSPRFLYLDEGNDEVGSKLTAYELATRLS